MAASTRFEAGSRMRRPVRRLLGGDLTAALEDLQGLRDDIRMLARELNLVANRLSVLAYIQRMWYSAKMPIIVCTRDRA